MSNNRVKNVSYDDDDLYDDGYDSPDPEEQEALAQCTTAVLQQLRAGQPSVTATKEEVQEALWHYYNDVEKSVNYLRSKKEKEIAKQQSRAQNGRGLLSTTQLFCAADFFRDSPWLNIPAHRKADILIEPLHPRLGLLGGAPENGGKVSKLAALAAARKKRESEKAAAAVAAPAELPSTVQSKKSDIYSTEVRNTSLSLRERLTANAKLSKASDESSTLKGLAQLGLSEPVSAPKLSLSEPMQAEAVPKSAEMAEGNAKDTSESLDSAVKIRAPPSMFASAILGHEAEPRIVEPGHLDLLEIYGQYHAKPFDFAGPSPDDAVLSAQEKGFKSKPTASKAAGNKKTTADVTNGMNDLSVEEKVTVKSKNLDVLAEYSKSKKKKAANFVVIGHVDAGKSTLMGRLLADQGAIDQRTLEKYRKEAEKIGKGSFALAWVLDQGSEERARGVTIDIATNKFETDTTAFTIVDAPGHRDFVPNMIAGASQADFAVLVIDASTGKFESGLKGQTKEHALLVRSMGVQKIVVAVNKMDAVEWNKDRFDEIEQHISSFLTTAGFHAKNISFVPCSGVLGQNISKNYEDPSSVWYNGRTLIEELETSEPFTYALDKPLRMTIGDVFRGGVQSPISISGRLDAGSLQVGDQILTMPSGETALIRSLEVDSEPSDWAVAGQNVTLHLANIDPVHLRSGDVVCRASSPIATITTFTAKVLAFEHLMPMMVDVHRGRLHVPGRISKLVASLDKASGAAIKKRPKIVAPGTVVRIVVEMDQAVPLEAPTRIVLRSAGSTIAAGLLE